MIFDIGKDSEEAQKHIVQYLKSQNKGPLAELTTAERAEEVKKAIAKQRGPTKPTNGSYASKAAAAGSLNSAPKQAPPKRPEPRGAATGKSPDRVCWQYRSTGECKFQGKCKFDHVASAANSSHAQQRPKEPGWQVAGGRNKRKKSGPEHVEVLKVHSKADLHPGRWRRELQKLDQETFDLTSWIIREGDWFVLHATADDADDLLGRLTPLRKLKWTVEAVAPNISDNGSVCANFMKGQECDHARPCK
jgi:hypothetical protein